MPVTPTPRLIKLMEALRNGPVANTALPGKGFTAADRELVNGLGYVESGGKPITHTLTAAGREALDAQPEPAPAPSRKPSVGLTPNQILALVVLMAEAREMTNKELSDAAGFALTGADNKKLVDRGLVVTDRGQRPFAHQLTDAGWHFVRTLHETEPPRESRSATRTVFTLLRNVHRALDRLQVSPGEFFKQTPTVAAAAPVDAEREIRAAYRALAKSPGAWIGLADLRDHLATVPRVALDDALRAMLRDPAVQIIPVANVKGLTARDRQAAVQIGGEDHHAFAIEPS